MDDSMQYDISVAQIDIVSSDNKHNDTDIYCKNISVFQNSWYIITIPIANWTKQSKEKQNIYTQA